MNEQQIREKIEKSKKSLNRQEEDFKNNIQQVKSMVGIYNSTLNEVLIFTKPVVDPLDPLFADTNDLNKRIELDFKKSKLKDIEHLHISITDKLNDQYGHSVIKTIRSQACVLMVSYFEESVKGIFKIGLNLGFLLGFLENDKLIIKSGGKHENHNSEKKEKLQFSLEECQNLIKTPEKFFEYFNNKKRFSFQSLNDIKSAFNFIDIDLDAVETEDRLRLYLLILCRHAIAHTGQKVKKNRIQEDLKRYAKSINIDADPLLNKLSKEYDVDENGVIVFPVLDNETSFLGPGGDEDNSGVMISMQNIINFLCKELQKKIEAHTSNNC